jgi:stage II sporulation protein AA (anti-sigma F factor antagonist)
VVDLTHAAFLDSSGLGALTNSMRRIQRKGGRLVVINTNEQMRRVFELTGLVRVLNVVSDREHALAFIDEQRDGDQP